MKDLRISRELIKVVLEKETETLSKDFNFNINEDYIEFSDDGEMQFEYCIYKFAFRCKEWAYSTYGIMIQSYPYCGKSRANTEVEAVIKASEYVLKELK